MRRKVVHGKVQGQRQKDRKVVGIGILATLLHSLTKLIGLFFREFVTLLRFHIEFSVRLTHLKN